MSSASRLRTILVWLTALIIFGLLPLEARRAQISLEPAETITGWWLFGLMIFLALFNARKKLSMVPLGNAATWLLLHAVGGVLALVVYWLHTRNLWPIGSYEQLLAVLFYATVLTGVFGYLIQRFYPDRLTQTGMEIIYERIPREISELRQRAEELVLECTEKTEARLWGVIMSTVSLGIFGKPVFSETTLLEVSAVPIGCASRTRRCGVILVMTRKSISTNCLLSRSTRTASIFTMPYRGS